MPEKEAVVVEVARKFFTAKPDSKKPIWKSGAGIGRTANTQHAKRAVADIEMRYANDGISMRGEFILMPSAGAQGDGTQNPNSALS